MSYTIKFIATITLDCVRLDVHDGDRMHQWSTEENLGKFDTTTDR